MSIMDDAEIKVPYWTVDSPLQEGHPEKDYRVLLEAYLYARSAYLNLFIGRWTPCGEETSARMSAALGVTHSWTDAECEEMIDYMIDHQIVEPYSRIVDFLTEVMKGKLEFACRYYYNGTCPFEFIKGKCSQFLM